MLNLCYSQNVFPADGKVVERVAGIAVRLNQIRESLGSSAPEPFPLGLWLDAASAAELADPAEIRELRSILDDNGNSVITLNAFPYGGFHGTRVKDLVYLPDWSSRERLDYTLKMADILAELLPMGGTGSISTLPGGYRWRRREGDGDRATSEWLGAVAANLRRVAEHLAAILADKGARILLAVEMEPDCVWESPAEFIEFREMFLKGHPAEEFVGVCYDTCHQELLAKEPGSGLRLLEETGVPVPKIQLSAALTRGVRGGARSVFSGLADFADGVYLHQTRIFDGDSKMTARFPDIPSEPFPETAVEPGGRLVSHFHIPVHLNELFDGFSVAKAELETVLKIISKRLLESNKGTPHLEIETYTYDVLPRELRGDGLIESMTREYEWVLEHLAVGGVSHGAGCRSAMIGCRSMTPCLKRADVGPLDINGETARFLHSASN